MVQHAVNEATGTKEKPKPKNDVSERDVVVLGSGNLGLVYLMEIDRRLTGEEIDARHPDLIPALRAHPHIGWLLVRSSEHGAVVLGPDGVNYLDEGRVEGVDPLAHFSPTAARHLQRTDGFAHVADIMIGSFYDPMLDEGCAFEELISLPRRARWPADPRLHPRARPAAAAGGADHGSRRRARRAVGLAPDAPGPAAGGTPAGRAAGRGRPSRLAGGSPRGGQQLGCELGQPSGVDEVARQPCPARPRNGVLERRAPDVVDEHGGQRPARLQRRAELAHDVSVGPERPLGGPAPLALVQTEVEQRRHHAPRAVTVQVDRVDVT